MVGGISNPLSKDVELVNLNEVYYECEIPQDFPFVALDPVGGLLGSALTVCGGIALSTDDNGIKKDCYRYIKISENGEDSWNWENMEPMTIGKFAAASVVTPSGGTYISIPLNYT